MQTPVLKALGVLFFYPKHAVLWPAVSERDSLVLCQIASQLILSGWLTEERFVVTWLSPSISLFEVCDVQKTRRVPWNFFNSVWHWLCEGKLRLLFAVVVFRTLSVFWQRFKKWGKEGKRVTVIIVEDLHRHRSYCLAGGDHRLPHSRLLAKGPRSAGRARRKRAGGRLVAGSRLSVERSGRADLVWFAGHRGLVIIDSAPTGPSKLDLSLALSLSAQRRRERSVRGERRRRTRPSCASMDILTQLGHRGKGLGFFVEGQPKTIEIVFPPEMFAVEDRRDHNLFIQKWWSRMESVLLHLPAVFLITREGKRLFYLFTSKVWAYSRVQGQDKEL